MLANALILIALTNYLFDEERLNTNAVDELKVIYAPKAHERARMLPSGASHTVTQYQHSVIQKVTNTKFDLSLTIKSHHIT